MGLAQDVLVEIVGGNVHLDRISEAVGSSRPDVVNAVQRLKRRELVLIDAPGCYIATSAGIAWVSSGQKLSSGQATPRPRNTTRGLRQRAWWVIRARKTFSLPELLLTLADGSEKDAAGNLGRYLKRLSQAGFLALTGRRAETGHLRYRVTRNNGRLAPVVRTKTREVFDPNTGEVFPLGDV